MLAAEFRVTLYVCRVFAKVLFLLFLKVISSSFPEGNNKNAKCVRDTSTSSVSKVWFWLVGQLMPNSVLNIFFIQYNVAPLAHHPSGQGRGVSGMTSSSDQVASLMATLTTPLKSEQPRGQKKLNK